MSNTEMKMLLLARIVQLNRQRNPHVVKLNLTDLVLEVITHLGTAVIIARRKSVVLNVTRL